MKPILSIQNGFIHFGSQVIVDDWECHVMPQDKICLIGQNGAGKSTLFKVLSQLISLDKGDYFKQPGLRVGYLQQKLIVDQNHKTALDYMMQFCEEEYIALEFLSRLKVEPSWELTNLSGGQNRRLCLASALAQNPDVLLLDEPTNHLDIESIEWLEDYLNKFKGAFVVISHDRAFLKKISRKIWWLYQGEFFVHNEGYAKFEEFSERIFEEKERDSKRLNTQLKKETEWLHRGVTARRKRNQGRLKKLYELRDQKRKMMQQKQGSLQALEIGKATQSQLILEAQDLCFELPNNRVIGPLNCRLLRSDRIGIMGPNGVGKTALIKVLLNQMSHSKGSIRFGDDIKVQYIDQTQSSIDGEKTVWENIADGGSAYVMVQGQEKHVVGYLKDFLFNELQVKGKANLLSGGEKNRLALAKAFTQQFDLMILDEPTNDLDYDTLELLEEVLSDYKGALIVISHDREFLDQISTLLWIIREDGKIYQHIGSYDDYKTKVLDQELADLKSVSKYKSLQKADLQPLKIKISYQDKYLHENLLNEIEMLNEKLLNLENKISDPDFYGKNIQLFNEYVSQIDTLKKEIESKENQWILIDEKIKKMSIN